MKVFIEYIRRAFEDGIDAIMGASQQMRTGVGALLAWAFSDQWVWLTFIYLIAFLILTL